MRYGSILHHVADLMISVMVALLPFKGHVSGQLSPPGISSFTGGLADMDFFRGMLSSLLPWLSEERTKDTSKEKIRLNTLLHTMQVILK